MMKVVIASDSFKGSMTSSEVADVVSRSIKHVDDVDIVKISISDGGEGFVQSILDVIDGEIIELDVVGPLGDEVKACYGLTKDRKTAIIEVAATSGICLVPETKRNPLKTTTYGFGQLIIDALDKEVEKIIIGLGGSATNDCGMGMAEALGIKFFDKDNNEITMLTGEKLDGVKTIDGSDIDPRINKVKFEVACDVDNPLVGENGAAYIFGPQKGANKEQVKILDNNLVNIAKIIYNTYGIEIATMHGAGAAGGLGAATKIFLGAEIKQGINLVLDMINFDELVKDADFIITGEGKMDSQSVRGKTPYGVLLRAKKYNVPVIGICGMMEDQEVLINHGFEHVYSVVPKIANIQESLNNPKYTLDLLMKEVVEELSNKKNLA